MKASSLMAKKKNKWGRWSLIGRVFLVTDVEHQHRPLLSDVWSYAKSLFHFWANALWSVSSRTISVLTVIERLWSLLIWALIKTADAQLHGPLRLKNYNLPLTSVSTWRKNMMKMLYMPCGHLTVVDGDYISSCFLTWEPSWKTVLVESCLDNHITLAEKLQVSTSAKQPLSSRCTCQQALRQFSLD